ncbi:MAG TPA: adenylate/guanylate cyclase domain-containing protein, partial [Acidimicrobiia bacterium]|nr:adenylate/guanylate cyclase domain-containing protein [Acidimicrobiia bacterium]
PEQIRNGEASEQSDLYAVGLILFEMLTGRCFHRERSRDEIVAGYFSGRQPESPGDLGADLEPELARLVLSCLRTDPAERPRSAREIGDRIAALREAGLTASTVLAATPQPSTGSGKALAALMFTDIVGSVDLQQRLGTEAYLRFVARHDEILTQCLAQAPDARILNETGDGFLVRFGDPSEAVMTALRLQSCLHDERVEGERISVRIGLHLGGVTEMEEKLRGEKRVVGMPVNLAARVMDLAEGGQILMTRAVYEDARQFVREHPPVGDAAHPAELRWMSHGLYSFKGNAEPLEIFEVGAADVAPMKAPEDGSKAKRTDRSPSTGAPNRGVSNPAEAAEVLPPEKISNSDVLIAYANLDDHPIVSGHHGWVSQLHENLQVRVAQLSGKNVAVVKVPDALAREEQEAAVLEHVPGAKTVISVLSPPFVRSDGCQRVVETFWKRTAESGHFEVDHRSRLLNVVKTPVAPDEIPARIRALYTRLSPYEFFERDPVSGRLREFDEAFGETAVQRFHERVYDVAYDVSQVLKHFGDAGRHEAGAHRTSDPKTVFLAATTSDLEPQRDRLRRELVELGHKVVPNQPLPLVASDLVAVVRGCLEQADIAIHLVGEHFGLVPEATELSVVALQNQVAAEFCGDHPGLRRLIWMQRGLQPKDDRQSAFIRRLESDSAAVAGAELIADTLENLKVLLLSRWERARPGGPKPSKAPAGNVRRLYIICDQQDEEAVESLEDFFYAQGIEISLPAFEADEAETQQIHIRNLSDCDAVLIYYGAASMHWVDFKIRDLQKAAGYREGRPIPSAAVYLAPPDNRRKERFKTVLADVVRQAGDAFDPAVRAGFVEAVRHGEEVAG